MLKASTHFLLSSSLNCTSPDSLSPPRSTFTALNQPHSPHPLHITVFSSLASPRRTSPLTSSPAEFPSPSRPPRPPEPLLLLAVSGSTGDEWRRLEKELGLRLVWRRGRGVEEWSWNLVVATDGEPEAVTTSATVRSPCLEALSVCYAFYNLLCA
ncbi:hypothetical protein Droror1_Dr00004431 [Drosera rotundifolia]